MKRNILISFFAIILAGCLPEYRDGCPEDLGLIFMLEDEYETGTYDTRIASDVLLAIYKEKQLSAVYQIDYHEIAKESEFVIRKDDNFVGQVEMIAWAASGLEGYDPSAIPAPIEDLVYFSIGLEPLNKTTRSYYQPADCGLYVGVKAINEKIDETSVHTVNMLHYTCRVEVHVTDGTGIMGTTGEETAVAVHGSMSRMDLEFRGTGEQAVVWTPLETSENSEKEKKYTTGRFGIMPSAEGQTVSVEILSGEEPVAVLTVPNSALPTGAKAGSLIIFEYVIGEASFLLTIDGFTQRIVIIEGV